MRFNLFGLIWCLSALNLTAWGEVSLDDHRWERSAYSVAGKTAAKCTATCKFKAVRHVVPIDPAEQLNAVADEVGAAFSKISTDCTNLCAPDSRRYRGKDGNLYDREDCHISFCSCSTVQEFTRYADRATERIYYGDKPVYYNHKWASTGVEYRELKKFDKCNAENGAHGELREINKPYREGVKINSAIKTKHE